MHLQLACLRAAASHLMSFVHLLVCSAGFPVLIIAFLGGYVHQLVPNVMSFTDFVRRRFGPFVQIYVSLLMLFNSESRLSSLCP